MRRRRRGMEAALTGGEDRGVGPRRRGGVLRAAVESLRMTGLTPTQDREIRALLETALRKLEEGGP
jgi:hypothetical protein